MLAQLPSNMLITRVRPAVYLPVCALLWSGVSAATAAVTSAGQLFAVQFVLGIIEAPLFPGVSLNTQQQFAIGLVYVSGDSRTFD
jgi:hypothetical protein